MTITRSFFASVAIYTLLTQALSLQDFNVTTSLERRNFPGDGSGCVDPDISAERFVALESNGLLLDFLATIGSPAGFPTQVGSQLLRGSGVTWDCANLLDDTNCQAPKGAGGHVCEMLAPEFKVQPGGSGQAVLVLESYDRMYHFLQDAFFAIDGAILVIKSSTFLQDMRREMQPRSDLAGTIFSAILDIGRFQIKYPISFIPIGGAEVAALKNTVKVFKKLTKETIKAVNDAPRGQVPSIEDLTAQLDSLKPVWKKGIQDQFNQIFVESNDDSPPGQLNPQFIWLQDGLQLKLNLPDGTLQANIEQQLKNFMIASFVGSLGARVVATDKGRIGGIECCGGCDGVENDPNNFAHEVRLANGTCHQFFYPKAAILGGVDEGSALTLAEPLAFRTNPVYGISLEGIMDNAVRCKKGGGDFNTINTESFLDDPISTRPECLFGFPGTVLDDGN